uniref:Uncharacterized protein n=1 Tax=Nelumbo nucifera TaxID=4432 RepID=A0A822XUW9_NELNU|nr:TPA_asm: hypothetical protein HUJ06_024189 [Nelumbo nucifera]
MSGGGMELEQRLSDQYLQGHNLSSGKDVSEFANSSVKIEECKSELSGDGEAHMPYISTEPMDEFSCTAASLDAKVEHFNSQPGKAGEG